MLAKRRAARHIGASMLRLLLLILALFAASAAPAARAGHCAPATADAGAEHHGTGHERQDEGNPPAAHVCPGCIPAPRAPHAEASTTAPAAPAFLPLLARPLATRAPAPEPPPPRALA